MNYTIQKTDNGLENIKKNFQKIVETIKKSENPEMAKETLDKVKLAREWAKIQSKTEEMYKDLLRIEIECFRRIYQLKCINILHGNKRKMAQFYGEMTDNEIENLINNDGGKSAYKIYRDYIKDDDFARHNDMGRDFASGEKSERDYYIHDQSETDEQYYIGIAKRKTAAIAVLLDEYSSKNQNFTIEEFADDLIMETNLDEYTRYGVEGFKEGIREICRDAVRSAKTLFVKGRKTPRFVTCLSGYEKYVRIPFENAKISQFEEMIELRKEQLRQDQEALNNLLEIHEILKDSYDEISKNKKLKPFDKTIIKDIIGSI